MTLFTSDNVSGIHPNLMNAISQANTGYALPYGADRWSTQLDTAFSELFETEVLVIPAVNDGESD